MQYPWNIELNPTNQPPQMNAQDPVDPPAANTADPNPEEEKKEPEKEEKDTQLSETQKQI